MTPGKRSKMFPAGFCGGFRATYKHMWWDCQRVKSFWRLIGERIEKILRIPIPCSLRIYLLHDLSELKISKPRKLLLNLSLATSLLLATAWKSEVTLSRADWLAKVRYMMSLMCKLSSLIKYRPGQYAAIDQF